MKELFYSLLSVAVFTLLQSCATIIGGSNYYASVIVKNHPRATIEYAGSPQGRGTAFMKVKRRKANSLTITVREEGCTEQTFKFTQRSFRGWALAGTIIVWTGQLYGQLLPWGVGVDLLTGALWKPTANEKNILKINYRNYTYVLDYSGCGQN